MSDSNNTTDSTNNIDKNIKTTTDNPMQGSITMTVNNQADSSSLQSASNNSNSTPDATDSEQQQQQHLIDNSNHSGDGDSSEQAGDDICDFIQQLDDYNPSIPDVVVHHYLNQRTNDKRVVRLIAIAAQKFIADIVSDSLQHCKLRDQTKKKDKRYVLTKEDLSAALAEHGITIKRPDYFN